MLVKFMPTKKKQNFGIFTESTRLCLVKVKAESEKEAHNIILQAIDTGNMERVKIDDIPVANNNYNATEGVLIVKKDEATGQPLRAYAWDGKKFTHLPKLRTTSDIDRSLKKCFLESIKWYMMGKKRKKLIDFLISIYA
jgi:hypothetical protein